MCSQRSVVSLTHPGSMPTKELTFNCVCIKVCDVHTQYVCFWEEHVVYVDYAASVICLDEHKINVHDFSRVYGFFLFPLGFRFSNKIQKNVVRKFRIETIR